MKKLLVALLSFGLLATTQAQDKTNTFGEKITTDKAISTHELVKKMDGKDAVSAKVKGEVESVCQVKGCWMKVKLDNGQTMRVTFKDYGFFVPKDIKGRTVVFEGKAQVKETSVSELKHFAEDAGKSKEEIAKITKPEKAITFVADGVVLQ